MADYPAIDVVQGIIAQLPYTEIDEQIVDEISLDCGFSYTRPQNASVLKKVEIDYNSITRPELTILENFWDEMNGALGEFTFKDDAGIVWPYTRFDMTDFVVGYPEPGRFSVTVKLAMQPPPA